MSVTLRQKPSKKKVNGKWVRTGVISLYLDVYHNGERHYEFLPELNLYKSSNPIDREQNKKHLELAEHIVAKRTQQLIENDYDLPSTLGKKTVVTTWMQAFIDNYKKKDKRNLQGALNRFKDFLIEENRQRLTFGGLTEDIISDYQDYLQGLSKGEGAASYFARFKKMVKHAFRKKLLSENPAAKVETKGGKARLRDILTQEEIQVLAKTPIESGEVRRAALFTAMTGLRWIEVKNLTWAAINFSDRNMIVMQSKTEREKTVNLNDTSIKLLGDAGQKDQFIFDLPTANGCNKTLKAWVKRAHIDKTITWHNLRHSFGTLAVFNGADITTVSNLMGHSTLRHTERYVKAAAVLKQKATDSLNINL